MADNLRGAVPLAHYRPEDEFEDASKPTDRSLAAFKEKIELMLEDDKKKKALSKEKKKIERISKQQSWGQATKRIQRYLGLRGIRDVDPRIAIGAALKDSGLGKQPRLSSCMLAARSCLYAWKSTMCCDTGLTGINRMG